MSKIINYSLIAAMVIVPVGAAGYMLNSKYSEFENQVNKVVNEINQSGFGNAQANFNRGIFNTNGQIQVNLSQKEQKQINIVFSARHGVETIIGNPIVVQTQGSLNQTLLFDAKTRYYPYYAETEYNIPKINIESIQKSGYNFDKLSGKFKFTYDSQEIENSTNIASLTINENNQVSKTFSEIYLENKGKINNLLAGNFFLKAKTGQTTKNLFSNISVDYNTEKSNENPALSNARFKITGSFSNSAAGNSNFINKITVYSIPISNTDGLLSNIVKANLLEDQNAKGVIANIIVKTINDGFEVDTQNEIITQKIGNFSLNASSSIKKSDGQKSIGDNLSLKGVINHTGPYVNYMYDLTEKLNIAVFKRKEELFSIDFSYQDKRAFINSTEVDPIKYFETISGIVSSL
jgi:hypothetical protein